MYVTLVNVPTVAKVIAVAALARMWSGTPSYAPVPVTFVIVVRNVPPTLENVMVRVLPVLLSSV